jgi:Skp family chaperone for outer membrane proteins
VAESGSGKSDDSEDTDAVRRLRTDNAALSAKLRLNTLQVAVEREAAKMGFIDPEDAFRLADFGDGEEFMDDKDKADSEAIREALEDLSNRKKHLVKPKSKSKSSSSSRNGEDDEDGDEDEDEDEDDDAEEDKKVVKGRRSGSPSRNGNKTATAGEKELKRRFPILSGNVRIRG